MRILIVEDETPARERLKRLLEGIEGVEIVGEAEDGPQAVERAVGEQFDLVLMDMQMPSLSGYDATEMIREKGVGTPIVALTANALKGDREKCIAAGCDDYLAKPMEIPELLRVLDEHLGEKVG